MKYAMALVLITLGLKGLTQDARKSKAYAETITIPDLKKHLDTIASATMEGRETATEGQRKAAAYIEQQFRDRKLVPAWNGSFQQTFPVYRDSLVNVSMNIQGAALKHDTDFSITSLSGQNVSLQADEVLFVGFGASDSVRDDYSNMDAKGKIILAIAGAPMVTVKGRKTRGRMSDLYVMQAAAKKNGAAALLIIDKQFPRASLPRKGRMYFKNYRLDSLPNTYFISDSVARLIMGEDFDQMKKTAKMNAPLAKSYKVKIGLSLEKSVEHLESTNVIGMIEGTDKKEEAIVITAHYDHLGKTDSTIYYGADDDGSGTVTVLELAEAFSKASDAGSRPRRNVIFMTVSGEEKGLWGSDYYSQHPAFPLDKTSVNLNIDMIGRIEKDRKNDSLKYLYVVGDNRLSSELRPISEEANRKHGNFYLDYKYNDPNDPERIFYRSDHYNFAKHGVPAIFYFTGLHEDYHQPSDTPDKINYPLLQKRGQLIFYTAWEMANRDNMLKRDIE